MHAIDNQMPYPFEIRWTESLISGGGYMINIPDNCLQVDGYTIDLDKWLNIPERISAAEDDKAIAKWYNLSSLVTNATEPSVLPSLSSFSIWLDAMSQQPTFILQTDISAPGYNPLDVLGMTHVADVVNKRPYPDVASHINLDKIDTPFRLEPLAPLSSNSNTSADLTFDWKLKDIEFQSGQQIIKLPELSVRYSDEFGINPTVLRLCYLESLKGGSGGSALSATGEFTWGIDRVLLSNMSKLELGDTLSAANLSGNYQVKSAYPLYKMSPFNGIRLDMRDAWYRFDTTGSTGMFTWDSLKQTPGPGGAMVGRTWVEAELSSGLSGDGFYQLEVDHGSYPFKATVVKGTSISQPPTDTKCWIPIYTISQGQVVEDRRGAFVVPIWEY